MRVVHVRRCLGLVGAGLIVASASGFAQAQPSREPARKNETVPRTFDLQPRFIPGRSTRYTLTFDAKSRLKSPGTPELDQDQSQTQTYQLVLRVVEAGSAGSTLELAYERVKIALRTPNGDVEADSAATKSTAGGPRPGPSATPGAKPPGAKPSGPTPGGSRPANAKPGQGRPGSPTSPPSPGTPGSGGKPAPTTSPDPLDALSQLDDQAMLEQHVRALAGTKLVLKTDAAGNLVSVAGGEQLAGGGLPGMNGMGGLGGVGGMAGAGPSPQAMANWIVASVGRTTPARIGETWTTSGTMSGTPIGGFSMRTTNTLRSASGRLANVDFLSQIEAGSASGGVLPGFQVRSADSKGNYTWDTEQHELESMSAATNTVIDGNVAGQSMSLSATQNLRVRRER